jgi:hypothetical protein
VWCSVYGLCREVTCCTGSVKCIVLMDEAIFCTQMVCRSAVALTVYGIAFYNS